MFNSHHSDRIKEWKDYRQRLEASDNPFQDVAEYWAAAPFVNSYLDPNNPASWPDPWKLILDGKYDNLAIVLGMLYTIKLTDRFSAVPCEIHHLISDASVDSLFFLIVDQSEVLAYEYRKTIKKYQLPNLHSQIIWQGLELP